MAQADPQEKIKVIQWSTGNVGAFSLRAIIGHPQLELAGVWVHSEKKMGADAGELCGLPPVGVAATGDADELLASDAQVVVYTATADTRPGDAVAEIAKILAAGKDVVSSSVVGATHAQSFHEDLRKQLEDGCRRGGSSFWTNGIDPGFANDTLPLVLTGLSEYWTEIRVQEIVNYATYDQGEVIFTTMGFGQPLDATPLLLVPGALSFGWGGALRSIAEGVGVELDEIKEVVERVPAPETFEIQTGTVKEGTMAALRFEVQGIVDGKPRIIVEHVTRLRDDLAPDWPQPGEGGNGGYSVIIEGVPRMVCRLDMEDEHGDHAVGGVILTATRLVNAIPAVAAAEPGLLSALDLPMITGRGLMR